MIRGTTPTLEFVLPFEADLLAVAYITLAQDQEPVVEKTLEDCKCEGKILTVRLSQEDTLKLSHKENTEIQIRARTRAGDAIASNIITVYTDRILKDGVI